MVINGVVRMNGGATTVQQQQKEDEEQEEEEEAISSWTINNNAHRNVPDPKDEDLGLNGTCLSAFKPMLETDWFNNININSSDITISNQNLNAFHNHHLQEIKDLAFCPNFTPENLLLQCLDSSSSCSPSQAFSSLDPSQSHQFLAPKSCFSSLLNFGSNPFDGNANGFDLGCESSFLSAYNSNQGSDLMGFSGSEFQATGTLLPSFPDNGVGIGNGGFGNVGLEGFDGSSGNNMFVSRANKVLRPLHEAGSATHSPPTLFQKRATLRHSDDKLGNLQISGLRYGGTEIGHGDWGGEIERKRKKREEEGEIEEVSYDVSGFNYDSDENNEDDSKMEESVKNNGGSNSNANSTVTGGGGGVDRGGFDQKGKKKGMPAKNLMAERRRRKRLNDRLYMLRSVVPKISKMDRASILGDAIDYLKELLQRINDLHNELESTPPGSLVPQPTNLHPLTPTLPTLPCRVKEELYPSSLPSPKNQPARVEVRVKEGRAVNIHMFCSRRPGLLLSTMRALDNLGLDIQQAVISCFNGFALDVFRAEQCGEGQDVLPEQIKAVLLDSAGFHGMM